jgi:hypothetical protein
MKFHVAIYRALQCYVQKRKPLDSIKTKGLKLQLNIAAQNYAENEKAIVLSFSKKPPRLFSGGRLLVLQKHLGNRPAVR